MYLPGTVGERIADLRSLKGWNQKELANRMELAPSQLSRIENGETKNISGDILIKLAKEFRVSADYILGLTTVSVPKSYDISELGLSEGAVKGLATGAVDVEILNRLLEHKSFPPADQPDTDLLSRHNGKGDYGPQPGHRHGDFLYQRFDEK